LTIQDQATPLPDHHHDRGLGREGDGACQRRPSDGPFQALIPGLLDFTSEALDLPTLAPERLDRADLGKHLLGPTHRPRQQVLNARAQSADPPPEDEAHDDREGHGHQRG